MNPINTENNASYNFVAPSIPEDADKKTEVMFPTAEVVSPTISSNKADAPVRRQKTIVLTLSLDTTSQLSEFHSLCINVPEKQLVRSLLMLQQHAHSGGKNLPPMPKVLQQKILSDREIEVMSLIVQGYINKEIADRLNIGLATVITHRKNIMDKLGMKSVSALTIYAIMHGYVDINKI